MPNTRSTRNIGDATADDSLPFLSKDLIPKFSGQDKTYPVTKWIQDVEDNKEIFGWTPLQQLLFARRSLIGTAALWIQSEYSFKTWDELKIAITKEFPDTLDQKTVHELMSQRKKMPNETYLEYVFVMKELGKRGKIPDYVAIKYIVDGIQDMEMNKIMLYGVTTYSDLKENLKIYETIKEKMKNENVKNSSASTSRAPLPVRCFSCGNRSHITEECPHRELGRKCFNCNEFGHISAECPEKTPPLKSITWHPNATKSADDRRTSVGPTPVGSTERRNTKQTFFGTSQEGATDGDDLHDESVFFVRTDMNNVSQQGLKVGSSDQLSTVGSDDDDVIKQAAIPIGRDCNMAAMSDVHDRHGGRKYNRDTDNDMTVAMGAVKDKQNKMPVKNMIICGKRAPALIDSGSGINLIGDDFYEELSVKGDQKKFKSITLTGLGQIQINTRASFTTDIVIDDQSYKKVLFHVISRDCMPFKVILGNDFLKNVMMCMNGGSVWFKPKDDEWLNCMMCDVDVSSDSHHINDPVTCEDVKHLVDNCSPERSKEPPIKMKMGKDIEIYELQQERKKAKERILKVQKENERYYNKTRKESKTYKLADIVTIKRTQYGTAMKLKPMFLGPNKISKIKRNDCYDIGKINVDAEGPNRTSISADNIKPGPEIY